MLFLFGRGFTKCIGTKGLATDRLGANERVGTWVAICFLIDFFLRSWYNSIYRGSFAFCAQFARPALIEVGVSLPQYLMAVGCP
ncbi:MAG: hypothetical protein FWD76_01830 [Firmicutes bacterium]|nr:hypothetical protein [Bacillota bacterium]